MILLSHLFQKILQHSPSFLHKLLFEIASLLLPWNSSHKTTRPIQQQYFIELIKLSVSSVALELAVFIIAFNAVCHIFRKVGAYDLEGRDTDTNVMFISLLVERLGAHYG